MIARPERRHFAANRFDNPSCFMTKDHRKRVRQIAIDDVQIRMANACSNHSHQHLARSGRCNDNIGKHHWRSGPG